MTMGLDGSKLEDVLAEELMGLEWDIQADDVRTQEHDEYLEPGARVIRVWGMAHLPRSIYIIEAEQLRKEIGGKEVSRDIELTLTVSATSQMVAKGRGENVSNAYDELLRSMAKHIAELQRAQRGLEMLGFVKQLHNTEHNLYGWNE